MRPKVNWSKCLLDHAVPSDFTTSQWFGGHVGGHVGKRHIGLFLAFRLTLFTFLLANYTLNLAVHDTDEIGYFLIYLTNQGITFFLLHETLHLLLVAKEFYKKSRDKDHYKSNCMTLLHKLAWLVSNVNSTLSVFITLVYWSVLYQSSDGPPAYFNVFVHGINSVITVTDILVSARPYRLHHMYMPMLAAPVYTLFTLIYFWSGGLNPDGGTAIYAILDWAKPGLTTGVAVLCVLSLPFVNCFVYALFRFRVFIYEELLGNRSGAFDLGDGQSGFWRNSGDNGLGGLGGGRTDLGGLGSGRSDLHGLDNKGFGHKGSGPVCTVSVTEAADRRAHGYGTMQGDQVA